jgi:Domain of unknown function (DUF4389)
MSEAVPLSGEPHHPIGLIVTDDLERSRLTTFFRLILAIPHLIFVGLWGIAAYFALIIAWFAALFTGRVPLALHVFMADWLRYSTRVTAYTLLLSNPFPPFSAAGDYPIDARIDDGEAQSRLTVFFRLILAIPALILASVFQSVNQVVAFLSWFYILIFGRMNEGMENLNAWLLRYEVQTYGYIMLLTPRYPSLAGAPTA